MMPFYYNEEIFSQIFTHFVELVNNKNSVCVLKVILKLVTLEEEELICNFRKRLIDNLTLNTEQIIKNEFGNYFIQ